jgi:hypothetical protein
LSIYRSQLESPWDEIAIDYVLVVQNVAKNRPGDAFKEQTALVGCVYIDIDLGSGQVPYAHTPACRSFFRYFILNNGWTLPALFAILRDLRDLAFDVRFPESFVLVVLRRALPGGHASLSKGPEK